jgi:transposase
LIFENVDAVCRRSAQEPNTLRISLDTKAKVKVGEFSRGGVSRGAEAVKAVDHDLAPLEILVPFCVLEVSCGARAIDQPWLAFGNSKETADFIADCLEHWWTERKGVHENVTRIQIELDNGPEISSSRTQFMKRLVEFVDAHQIVIELTYFPPYHSKYNPVERFWGVLEQHWNGTLLSSSEIVLNWARTVTWRGINPIVRDIQQVYERGVTLTRLAFRPISNRLQRSLALPKWSVVICPV